jgi:hypothetical protein
MIVPVVFVKLISKISPEDEVEFNLTSVPDESDPPLKTNDEFAPVPIAFPEEKVCAPVPELKLSAVAPTAFPTVTAVVFMAPSPSAPDGLIFTAPTPVTLKLPFVRTNDIGVPAPVVIVAPLLYALCRDVVPPVVSQSDHEPFT